MSYPSHKIAVLGAGAVGLMYCAYGKRGGNKPALWANPAHRTDYHLFKGLGHVETTGIIEGKFEVDFCDDLADALRGARSIYIAVPCHRLPALLQEIRTVYEEALANNKMTDYKAEFLFLTPGNFGAIFAARVLGERKPLYIVELESSPINCRMLREQQAVFLKQMKARMGIASLPGKLPAAAKHYVEKHLPSNNVNWYASTLELGFRRPGPLAHVPAMTGSVSVIQNPQFQAEARMYQTLMGTAGISRKITKMSEEVQKVARIYGIDVPSILERFNTAYGMRAATFSEFAKTTPSHNATKGTPTTLDHRYISEDVATVMVVWERLAELAHEKVDLVTSEITQASVLNAVDYRAIGRAVELGLDKLTTIEQVKVLFQ